MQSCSDIITQFWFKPLDRSNVVVISAGCDCRGMRDRLVSILDRSSRVRRKFSYRRAGILPAQARSLL
ncbi:MAG: hypothetical protein WCA35_32070, partial [Kovacikia sp.]